MLEVFGGLNYSRTTFIYQKYENWTGFAMGTHIENVKFNDWKYFQKTLLLVIDSFRIQNILYIFLFEIFF